MSASASPSPASPRLSVAHWETAVLRPLLVYDDVVPAWAHRLAVQHPFHTWWWLRSGGVRIRHADQTLALGADDWIFFPCGQAREHWFEAGTRLISVSFHLAWPDGRTLLEFDLPTCGRGDVGLLRLGTRAARTWADPAVTLREGFARRQLDLPGWLHARAALHALAAELTERALSAGARARSHETREPRLARVLADLARELRAGPLPYAKWSGLAGLGRAQLDRVAAEHLGMSLRHWRDALLEDEIRRRIAAGQESMKEIGAALGFADAAHFNHWVRRRLGEPPSHWRRRWV